ncbi:MAG: MBL fold metallo-hydrolase [Oscillospiraceae bacterium]|nr:MBL fold metallo-hydrolase [Oscillospiraceae bacterium]
MFVTVLGSSGCRYDYGNDTASFLINNKIIVDTGWNLVENLLDLNLDPVNFRTVLFTHFHHDHYISLPQFLFYHDIYGTKMSELNFIGPGEDLQKVVSLAADFLQVSRFYEESEILTPKLTKIKSGENITLDFDCGEKLFIEAHKSIHPVDGRLYRVTDEKTGKITGFSGDTVVSLDEIEFFKDCDLLIHECSLGGKKNYRNDNLYMHASAEEAAGIASASGVKKLALAHYPEKLRDECFNAAKEKFSGEILTPKKGDIIEV